MREDGTSKTRKMPEVTVSILTYSQLAHAKRCIASVLAGGEEVNLILTANGNAEAAAYFTELAQNLPNVRVVVNAANQGFWKPNNHALTLTDTRWLVLLNDDAMVPYGWLNKLKRPFLDYPNDSVFSCPDDGCSELQASFHGKWGKKEYCEGSCLMIDVVIAKRHGLFEPMPGLAYGEDSHASLRFRELGYRLHWVPLQIIHARAQTSRTVPEVSQWQEQNHQFLRKRWAHYLLTRRMDYPIVIRRGGANGDVLLTTPIIKALRRDKPLSPIFVETICPAVLQRNPNVTVIEPRSTRPSDALVINLDFTYEANPAQHIVDAYAKAAEVTLTECKTEFFPSDNDKGMAASHIQGDWAAVHVGPSTWRSKEWPQDRFTAVIEYLHTLKMKVVLVGSGGMPARGDLDMRARTSIHEMGAIIGRCKIFIGLDSLPMHISQAMGTPTIGLFGITDPQYIMTDSSPHIGVCGRDATSFGLRHRVNGVTAVDDGGQAMNAISVDMVKAAIDELLAPK